MSALHHGGAPDPVEDDDPASDDPQLHLSAMDASGAAAGGPEEDAGPGYCERVVGTTLQTARAALEGPLRGHAAEVDAMIGQYTKFMSSRIEEASENRGQVEHALGEIKNELHEANSRLMHIFSGGLGGAQLQALPGAGRSQQ